MRGKYNHGKLLSIWKTLSGRNTFASEMYHFYKDNVTPAVYMLHLIVFI